MNILTESDRLHSNSLMRIAYFTDTYIPQVNGVTFVVENHAKLLSKKHKVKIYAPAYELRTSTETSLDKQLIIERYPSLPTISYKDIHIALINLYQLVNSVKKFNPDIIHSHSPGTIGVSAIIVSKLLKIPLVSTYHTLFTEVLPLLPPFKSIYKIFKIADSEKDLLKKLIWNSSKRFFDYCDAIVSPTTLVKSELQKHKHKSKIVVISNGIDTVNFKPAKTTKINNKIIYVGRLSHEKRVDIVIEAFRLALTKLPKLKLDIVGNGPALDELKNMVKKAKLNKKIKFYGYIERNKLPKYYVNSDLFITASEMEVQPLTILEAMACGLPIIGVNKGGVSSVVDDSKNGFLFKPADYKSMAVKIVEIQKNNKLRTKLSINSRILAEKESYSKSIAKLEKLYKSLFKK